MFGAWARSKSPYSPSTALSAACEVQASPTPSGPRWASERAWSLNTLCPIKGGRWLVDRVGWRRWQKQLRSTASWHVSLVMKKGWGVSLARNANVTFTLPPTATRLSICRQKRAEHGGKCGMLTSPVVRPAYAGLNPLGGEERRRWRQAKT